MKKVILTSAALLLCALFFTGTSFADDKFACVDLNRFFSEYGKAKDYDKALADKKETYDGEMARKENEFKQAYEKMELLSDKEKETKKSELEAKFKGLQDFRSQKEMDLRKERDEKMRELLKDIEDAVKQYAEKEGYTMVFDERLFIYKRKGMDITDKVLDILNKGYKK